MPKTNDTSVDPQTTVYFEIKKPPWVSVVWVVIACCICSKHDPCICSKQCNVGLSASIALVAAIDGASEVSGVFWNRKPSFDGASGASEVFYSEQKANF